MRQFTFLLICLTLLLLTACGGDGKQTDNVSQQDYPVGMTLMTWRFLPQDAQIIQDFENRYRTKINVVVKPMREIVAAAQNGQVPPADLLLVPSIEDATRLKGFNVLQPFFVDAFTNGEVGDRYLDDQGYYSGITSWAMATVYNPNAVTAEEARTYRGIVTAAARGVRIGVAHPDSSGLAGVVAGLSANLNQQAADVWARTVYTKATGGLFGNDIDQLNRMLAGEIDMALVSSGAATRWILNGNPEHFEAGKLWKIAIPTTEATNLNFFNMTCVTMPANAPNRDMAMAFINSLYNKKTQQILTDAWFEFPCHAFSEPNDYLYNYDGNIGTRLSAEAIENAVPVGWALINQAAGQ